MIPALAAFGVGRGAQDGKDTQSSALRIRRVVSDPSTGHSLTGPGNTLNIEMTLPKLVNSVGENGQ